jgi:DNA polymerase-3 subunit epsilon
MADVAVPVPGIRSVPLTDLEFTVVDVETTGWAPENADITEIGAVRVHAGTVIAEFGSLVNPGTPVPEAITELTGISDQMLITAPPVAAVLPRLLAFAEGSVLAAHNAPFDLKFLTAACAGMGRDWPGFEVLDTVRLARHLMATPQEVPDRKLATLATFFGTPVQPSHRALDDARATAAVLGQLLGRLTAREGVMTLDDLDAWLAARDAEAAARHAEKAVNGRTGAGAASALAGLFARLWRALRPRGSASRRH